MLKQKLVKYEQGIKTVDIQLNKTTEKDMKEKIVLQKRYNRE